jgi:hypothetical protein
LDERRSYVEWSVNKMVAWKKEFGLESKSMKVLGYDVVLVKLPSKWISLKVPMGKTVDDRAMFDLFVYKNQHLYNGKDEKKLVDNLKNFIIKWRKLSPSQKQYLKEGY